MSVSNVGGTPQVPVPDTTAVSGVSQSDINKITTDIAQYNAGFNTLATQILPNMRGLPEEFLNGVVTALVGIKDAINSQTPAQLASIPGFTQTMDALVNSLKAAESGCDAAINRTGVADFSVPPLSNQWDGTQWSAGAHGTLYDNVVKMVGMLNLG